MPWISCYAFDRTTNNEPSPSHRTYIYIPNRSDLANAEFILRQRHLYLLLCLHGKTQFKLRTTYRESAKGFVKFSSFILGWIFKTILGPLISFSSCQRNLIKTFQIEGMIALITKMTLIFSSDLLNCQK